MKLRYLIFCALFCLIVCSVKAQNCPYDNTFYVDLTPSGPGAVANDICVWGGDLITVGVVAGETYIFSTCVTTTVDVTMTLYNTAGTVILATDDDGCGAVGGPSVITWVATFTGVANLLIDEFPCVSATNCINLDVTWFAPCNADAGTVTVNLNSVSTGNTVFMCKGDCIDLFTDSNFILPPAVAGEEAELMFALYTGVPNLSLEPIADPNFSSLYWTGDNFADCNDPASVVLGAGLGPEVYFVPITMDDGDNNGNPNAALSYDNNGDSCWAFGTPVQVVFLDSITGIFSQNCATGVATILLNGGYPGFNPAAVYTVTNTGPGTMVQSGTQGEVLTFTSYTPGQTLTVNVTNDGNGCPATINYLTPPCSPCAADAGTSTVLLNGVASTSPILMCKGDCFDILTDSNFVLPPNEPGEVSELMYAFYTGVPNFSLEPDLDPNFSGLFWTGDDFSDCNGQTSIVLGAALPSEFWIVPITMDDSDNGANPNGIINYDQNDDDCYDLGSPLQVIYLDSITVTIIETCSQTTFVINGGYPGYNPAAVYSVTNTGAGSMSQTGASGDTLVFTGYTPGQTLSVNVSNDGNSCSGTFIHSTMPLPVILLDSVTNVSCNGANDGAVDVTILGDTADCIYTLNMADAFGDGWEGSFVDVVVNGVSVGNYTVGAASASATIVVPNGQSIELIYNYGGGIWEVDVTYDLLLNGIVIFSDGPTPSIGSVFTTSCVGLPYVYSMTWSNGGITEDISGLAANAYTLTVTDPGGCSVTSGPHTLTEPPALSIVIDSFFNAGCLGLGAAYSTASGGTGAYTFQWSNAATTEDVTGLVANAYSVTVSDINSCTATNSVTISSPSSVSVTASVTSNYNGAQISCPASSDGIATAVASGGTPLYNYLWSDGQTTASASGLPAGNHSVTVTDNDGCTVTASVVINQPAPLVSVLDSIHDVNCNNGSDGAVFFTSSGGTGALSFNWSNGATTEDITGLVANVYSVTVSDANSCSVTASVTVTEPSSPLSVVIDSTYVPLCNASSDGAVFVTSSGGTSTYSYLWSNGAVTEDISGLTANNYSVTATDLNGCTATADTLLSDPPAISVAIDSSVNTACSGTSGMLFQTASGGTGTLSFLWSNAETTEDITGLAASSYTVTVTDSNGCTATNSGIISNNSAGTISFTTSNVSCNAGTDGCIEATISGSSNGMMGFMWSNGSTVDSICGLAATTYTVTVTDTILPGMQVCIIINDTTISEPTALSVTVDSTDDVTCFSATGAAYISVSGGTGAYSYLWPDASTDEDATGLTANTYTVTVSDVNSCSATESVTITQSGSVSVTASVSSNYNGEDVSCFGSSDGEVTATGNGGTLPYSFLWNDGQTSAIASALSAGPYQVTVTDFNGCTSVALVSLTEPNTLAVSVDTIAHVVCVGSANGFVNISVSGGTGLIAYSWSNTETSQDIAGLTDSLYSVIVTDANGCTTTDTALVSTLGFIEIVVDSAFNLHCNNDSSGAIYTTATGDTSTSGCSSNIVVLNEIMYRPVNFNGINPNTGEYIELIGPPGANIGCYVLTDGDWTITIPPGTLIPADGLFTIGNDIAWGAGTFDLDAENCGCFTDGAGGLGLLILTDGGEYVALYDGSGTFVQGVLYGSPSAGNTPSGQVISTSATSGCPTFVTIPNAPSFETAPSGFANGTSIIRNPDATGTWGPQIGGSLNSCNVAGQGSTGNGSVTYIWSNGDTTQDVSGLAAGNYSVTATNSYGCTATTSYVLSEPAPLNVITSSTNVNCLNDSSGTLGSVVTGGVSPYAFSWSNSSTTQNVSGLLSGIYCLTATDSNLCFITVCDTIEIDSVLEISLVDSVGVSCNGGSDGVLSVAVSGGTANYDFIWLPGNATTASVSGLTAGLYSVSVTDANNCVDFYSVSLGQSPAIQISSSSNSVSCSGTNDGAATVFPSGGTPSYTYLWDATGNSQTTATATGLSSSTYSVSVTDSLGCIGVVNGIFVAPASPLDSSSVPMDTINGFLDCDLNPGGVLGISTTGLYTYLWSNGATTQNVSGLNVNNYSVTVTNSSGCTVVQSGSVSAPFVPSVNPFIDIAGQTSVTVLTGVSVNVNGGNDQSAQGVNYVWTADPAVVYGNDFDHSTNAFSDFTGSYSLTITATSSDSSACSDTGIVVLNVQSVFSGMPDAFSPNGDDVNELYFPVGLTTNEIVKFRVFNRWSQEIYNGDLLENGGWDGKYLGTEQPSEVYIYLLEYNLGGAAENKIVKGEFTLIR